MTKRVGIARWMLALSVPVAAILLFMPGMGKYLFEYADPLVPAWLSPIRADDLSHFIGATILATLLITVRMLGVARPRSGAIVAIALVTLLGPAIEWVQTLFGRGAETGDLLSHEAGVLLVAVCWLVHARPWRI